MSGWKAKRFWKEVQVVAAQGGYSVQLDGRPVITPAKTLLVGRARGRGKPPNHALYPRSQCRAG
jgi:chaperone required for assembly of F1-ATPase